MPVRAVVSCAKRALPGSRERSLVAAVCLGFATKLVVANPKTNCGCFVVVADTVGRWVAVVVSAAEVEEVANIGRAGVAASGCSARMVLVALGEEAAGLEVSPAMLMGPGCRAATVGIPLVVEGLAAGPAAWAVVVAAVVSSAQEAPSQRRLAKRRGSQIG